MQIAILISNTGAGTNLLAIIDGIEKGESKQKFAPEFPTLQML